MTFYSVSNPFPLVLNLQGAGLNDGDVYFGVAGQDPIDHPKTVYWDLAGTQVADQPIPTSGGYLYRSGTPANVYLDSAYSIKVLDKNGDRVYYQANVFDPMFQILAELAALQGPPGASMVGAQPPGAGAKTTITVQDELSRTVWLDDYTGTPDVALASAAAAGSSVYLTAGATYSFAALATLPANVTLYMNGATIQAAGGFTDKNLLTIAGNSKVIGPGFFVGTNVPAPTGAYSAGQYAGVGIYVSGTQTGGRIENITFSSFPSGPVLVNSASAPTGLIVRGCNFLNNQTYTSALTNALCHFHAVTNSRQIDCYASGYNWKGFYTANGNFNQIVRCHASGGVIGHASHDITGGQDQRIVDCSHTGTGFSWKCNESVRPVVENFASTSSYCGGLMQGCIDFQIIGCGAYDPVISGLDIDGSISNTCSGIVSSFRSKRAAAGTTVNQNGIRINPNINSAYNGLMIHDCRLENHFSGITFANGSVAMTNIAIEDNQIINSVQYGILAYIGSGRIYGNDISLVATSPQAAVTVASDGVTTGGDLEVDNNKVSPSTGVAFQIGAGFKLNYVQVSLSNNSATSGSTFLTYLGNTNATDFVGMLSACGNTGTGLSNGFVWVFNTTTATVLEADMNTLTDGSYAPVLDSVTNTTNLTLTGRFAYNGSPAGTFKATLGTIYTNRSGGAGATLFVKEAGGTAWAAK